jgi:hypothetical protein
MSRNRESPQEIESQRQESLRELESDGEKARLEHFSPGTFDCHELLDRTILLAEQVERSILSHPACIQNREWALSQNEAFALV